MARRDFSLTFWLHLALLVAVFTSPWLLPWRIITALLILYYVQLLIFGNCILTIRELGSNTKDTSFYAHYLRRLGWSPSRRNRELVLNVVLPAVLLGIALVWQEVWDRQPFIR